MFVYLEPFFSMYFDISAYADALSLRNLMKMIIQNFVRRDIRLPIQSSTFHIRLTDFLLKVNFKPTFVHMKQNSHIFLN